MRAAAVANYLTFEPYVDEAIVRFTIAPTAFFAIIAPFSQVDEGAATLQTVVAALTGVALQALLSAETAAPAEIVGSFPTKQTFLGKPNGQQIFV